MTMDKDMTMDVFEIDGSQIVWGGGGETVGVEPWGGHSLRGRAAGMSDVLDTDFALLPQPPLEVSIDVEDNVARLTNGNITAVMTASSFHADAVGYRVHRCALSFYNQHGTLLFKELDAGGSLNLKARELRPHLGGDFRITAAFESDPAEKLYGMGQYQQHILDIKGSTFELAHRNSQASVPFVMSSAGYGFLWHNPAIGRATFSTNRTEWFAGSSKQIDDWNPEEKPQPGQELLFSYRMSWGTRMPHASPLAQVVATRTGIGGIVGQKRTHFSWRFVVDFAGGSLAMISKKALIEPVISTSRGLIEIPSVRPLDAVQGYRAIFDLRPDDDSTEPINLRLILRFDGEPLSETWLYQWTPPTLPERAAFG